METPHSWPRRLLAALPPISDRAMALGFLILVFVLGLLVGNIVTLAGKMNGHTQERLSLPARLDALEQRVRALEQRHIP